MALSTQPAHLNPTTLSTIVIHDNYDRSKTPWEVMSAKCGTLPPLDKTKWDFHESAVIAPTRDATLTLAPDARDQIELLKAGKAIILRVRYPGNPTMDSLTVCMP